MGQLEVQEATYINHIGIRWLLAFRVYLYGWGLGTGNRWDLGHGTKGQEI